MKKEIPFNPLDKVQLGQSVADAMMIRPLIPLQDIEPFIGAGIYAIYYGGRFPLYASIALKNDEIIPIYVGKAVPPGARKGNFGVDSNPGTALYKRIKEHRESIDQTKNLEVSDFFCQYLVVDDIWIPLGESLLIAKFCPLWNKIIDGFGNHDPGKGRYNQLQSRWDALHPGRSWTEKCMKRSENSDQIATEAEAFLREMFA